jgi:uncharacterized protein (DUF1778 family)
MTDPHQTGKAIGMVSMMIAKQRQALELRKSGAKYDQIGAALEVSNREARDLVLLALDNKILDTVGQSHKLNLERLETLLLKVWGQAQKGNQGAIDRVLRILDRIDKMRKEQGDEVDENPVTAFPASAATPGQIESHSAYARFMEQLDGPLADSPLAAEYLRLRLEGWDWRKALYIAWSVLPTDKRQPPTLQELAIRVLGLKSTSSIRKWREKFPEIDLQIEQSALRVLRDDLPDILNAWKQSAKILGSNGHRDRITYLEHAGIYQKEQTVVQAGDPQRPVYRTTDFSDKDEDELDKIIDNLQAAT